MTRRPSKIVELEPCPAQCTERAAETEAFDPSAASGLNQAADEALNAEFIENLQIAVLLALLDKGLLEAWQFEQCVEALSKQRKSFQCLATKNKKRAK